MAVTDRIAAVGPYAQQLLDNSDVRDSVRQVADATRAAYQRARGQDARKAVQDQKLRRRVTAAVAAVGELVGAVSKTPPKPKSRWPRRLALLVLIGAAAWLISNESARSRIQELVGRQGADEEATSSASGTPTPV